MCRDAQRRHGTRVVGWVGGRASAPSAVPGALGMLLGGLAVRKQIVGFSVWMLWPHKIETQKALFDLFSVSNAILK